MGLIVTGSHPKDLLPAVNEWFGDHYGELETKYDKMFEVVSSDRSFEEDVLSAGLGLAKVKTEGASVQYDSMKQGYTKRYTHVVYANGFMVSREAFDDSQSGVLAKKKSKALAHSMNSTREVIAANVFNNAFDSNFTGGDSKELCATDHPTQDADLRNKLSTDADLSESSLEQAFIDLGDFKDDRGLRIPAMARKLIIPKELQFEAERILNSDLRPGTADNDANAQKNLGMIPEGVLMNHYLTDTDAWFLTTDIPDGLKYFNRRGMEVGLDNDFDTENAKFKATMRFAVGWSDPRALFGSQGA